MPNIERLLPPVRRHARTVVVVTAVVGVVVFVAWLVLYILPSTLVPDGAPDPTKAESDARTALIQALAGVLLVVGLVFTWMTLRLNRHGQITDRFTKAIAQLGDDKLDVRLGGIYALERIARDSKDDHRTIMEVLTAFLREHSAEGVGFDPVEETKGQAAGVLFAGAQSSAPRADTRAIVTVIGRRRSHEGAGDRLDLRGVQLNETDLAGFHLEGANLAKAGLRLAFLTDSHLEQALLFRANLMGAFLHGSHLKGASLIEACLRGANLRGADLRGADLTGADLLAADLRRADLRGVRLTRAVLTRAALAGADLTGAALPEADFKTAKASSETRWPEGFDPEISGVVIEDLTVPPTNHPHRGAS